MSKYPKSERGWVTYEKKGPVFLHPSDPNFIRTYGVSGAIFSLAKNIRRLTQEWEHKVRNWQDYLPWEREVFTKIRRDQEKEIERDQDWLDYYEELKAEQDEVEKTNKKKFTVFIPTLNEMKRIKEELMQKRRREMNRTIARQKLRDKELMKLRAERNRIEAKRRLANNWRKGKRNIVYSYKDRKMFEKVDEDLV